MAMVRKKQDDKYLEALRELITTGGGNRQCFDCGQKGPTYVNMTIGSFVCTRCSGVLRGITPPHRVKSISMATFTQDEIDFLKAHGNDVCAKTWLGLWDPKRAVHQDQRELMIDKYERKRYFLEPASPLKSLTNATNLKTTASAAAATSSTSSVSSITVSANGSQNNSTNNKTQIQLTPPTSQRTTANGLHKTSSTAISRPHHTTPQPQNGFSTSLSPHSTKDAFGLHNGLNSSIGSMSTGALSDTSSCASANGFGAEADFVADFGSADIFNATVASSPASSVASSTTNNGYAKIQPMKITAAAHQQFMNGHANHTSNLQNGKLSNGNTENFADFDHAPIYNAAVEEPPNYQFVRKNAIRKKSTSSVSSSIIQRNQRQLKDILEMDNNENAVDYINFNEDNDDVFGENNTSTKTNATKSTGGYSNLFDDFDILLALDDSRQPADCKEFESDYANVDRDHSESSSKFTPLALAAHATAMAVLNNQSHFNSQLQNSDVVTSKSFANKWEDVWSTARDVPATRTMPAQKHWFPSNHYDMSQLQYQQQQQPHQQLFLNASIANLNSGNLQTKQKQQPMQHYTQQYLPSSTFSSPPLTTSPSISSMATATATSMLNNNKCSAINSTNPFRMHLDVNDNYNTINNYDNTTTTPTTTTTFNTNFNDFNFVSNSILSFNNLDLFPTTANTTMLSSSLNPSSCITTATATLPPNQNYYQFNEENNSKIDQYSKILVDQSEDYEENVDVDKFVKNPFLNSETVLETPQNLCRAPQPQYSIYQKTPSCTTSSYSSSSINSFNANATATSIEPQTNNPFYSVTSHPTARPHSVADDNANNIPSSNNHYTLNNHSNYYYSSSSNNVDVNDVANNVCLSTNHNNNNYFNSNSNSNSNLNFDSYSNRNANANQKQNPNNYQNENNNSWRLPINNNNYKNSMANGFSNTNNNINNNNNSSAPAEDRYAALKDLDEQLRESKAVAAQAASIVTANVVESGFGNPNVNGTVNPFGGHHHQQPTTVVNPFQNVSNNPAQNTTQQLFGQMTLIPNGIAAANGFLNGQKTHTANTGFFNYTASGFTNSNTPPQIQQQQQQQQAHLLYPTSIQTGPNGCGFGFGTLHQQQIASTGTGLTTNTFNNPFAATGALNSNNPFL